ncbi:DUF11 domain-containing protein [Massilia sp. Mn16-1_5]|uniref:DUF11 domain-containing protein n=1 Tax=Massilia sp. Mn16-1_5 TaxID=2079199 RepID=UPI00109E7EDA|nr:DUF11 domain-containing protein [Massilia sp. Mn16-1_5]THC46541.1 hypothetical protein C2862_00100 [Massilia sp. Mn16-1_5]
MRRPVALVAHVLALLVLLFGTAARADTPIALWKAFDGRVNFTGTQVTLRTKANSTNNGNNNTAACTVTLPSTNRTAYLGIPLGATVLSAQLYWAGSGTMDSTVRFENQDVSAGRKYSSSTVGGGFNYFGGAADVTAIVKAKGSGTYNFSGLTVSNGSPWCASQGVLGGFSLLVVYSHPTQPERVLNLYEGFRYVQNAEVIVNASNFRWNRTSYPVKEKARIGHITWEGDSTLAQDGERLLFEGTEMTDSLNPEGNQFNSRSNINNDSASYGIDFDAYDTSVTVWAGYDATVTTRYRTGQDMVILNAEVLVVPTMPVSDLSIALVRNTVLKVGSDAQYTVTVTNNGPYTEAGPITVSNTLPDGMSYVSGGGTGWTCGGTTTAGSCVYRGALAPGSSAPALVVKAAVTSGGDKTNTVTVKGTDDDNLANNSASDTATAVAAPPPPPPPPPTTGPKITYEFTNQACAAGLVIGATTGCTQYDANILGGSDKNPKIYLTAVIDGKTGTPNAKESTTVAMTFMLKCRNPTAGKVGATLEGKAIPVCSADDPWSKAVDIVFPQNAVSVPQTFVYGDIGQVELHLKANDEERATAAFISAPTQIAFRNIVYPRDETHKDPNQGTIKVSDQAFAPAGSTLTLEVGALLADGGWAPNFGNETPAPLLVLGKSAITDVQYEDEGKLIESGTPSWAGGIRTSYAAWSEVGAINFSIGLGDPTPDGSGKANNYLGVNVPGSTVVVGRFYPAYFRTEAVGRFNCPANLDAGVFPCPRATEKGVNNGAVYSGQPFDVTVQAYNAMNQPVKNFTTVKQTAKNYPGWFRPITLRAVGSAGGGLLAPDFTPTAPATSTTIDASTSIPAEKEGDPPTIRIMGSATYTLPAAYSNTSHRSTAISEPTGVFVRALASDNAAAGKVAITSDRGKGENSDENGLLVLSGRLAVPNVLGTDILPTALGLRAEFWAGSKYGGWLFNRGYTEALAASGDKVKFLVCSANFAKDGKCDTNIVAAMAVKGETRKVNLVNGAGTLWLRAPGKLAGGVARTGSFTLQFDGWTWLPSTIGRVSFGSYRSPVIYVREMYF